MNYTTTNLPQSALTMLLDIKIQIAVQHPMAWIRLVQADRDFYLFSQTAYGIKLRNEYFATVEIKGDITWHKLFGRLHRDDDLPAKIWDDGSQDWYQHGQLHRDNDLPAIDCVDVYAVVPTRQTAPLR